MQMSVSPETGFFGSKVNRRDWGKGRFGRESWGDGVTKQVSPFTLSLNTVHVSC